VEVVSASAARQPASRSYAACWDGRSHRSQPRLSHCKHLLALCLRVVAPHKDARGQSAGANAPAVCVLYLRGRELGLGNRKLSCEESGVGVGAADGAAAGTRIPGASAGL